MDHLCVCVSVCACSWEEGGGCGFVPLANVMQPLPIIGNSIRGMENALRFKWNQHSVLSQKLMHIMIYVPISMSSWNQLSSTVFKNICAFPLY